MTEYQTLDIDFSSVPETLQGVVSSATEQILGFLRQNSPNIDSARLIVRELKKYLKEQVLDDSATSADTDQLITTLETWVNGCESALKDKEKQKKRAEKMREVEEFWKRIVIPDPFSILDISEYRDESDDAILKKQIKSSYRALSLLFHSDVLHQILEKKNDPLKDEVDQIFKLIGSAYNWLDKWVDNQRPPWLRFQGFSRYEGRKQPYQEQAGSDAQEEKSGDIEYDVPLTSIRADGLRKGDYLHVKTNFDYLVYEVIDVNEGRPRIQFISAGIRKRRQVLGGEILSPTIATGNMLKIGSSGFLIELFQVSKSSSRKDSMNTESGQDSRAEQQQQKSGESQLEYDKELQKVIFGNLSIGDFLHLKTNNSYYVFEVVNVANGRARFKFRLGTSNAFADLDDWCISESLSVDQRFAAGKGKTSNIKKIVVSKDGNYNQTFSGMDKKNILYRLKREQINVANLVVGDIIILSDGNHSYSFTVTDINDKGTFVRCKSDNSKLDSATGRIDVAMIRKESKFVLEQKGLLGGDLLSTQYIESLELQLVR